MENFFIRYHIKGGNRVLTRKVSNYSLEEAMSEVLYDLRHNDRVLFNSNPDRVVGIFVESISFFEVLTEKEFDRMNELDKISGMLKGAFK